jgi:molybdenum cofactor guanylyltransferase
MAPEVAGIILAGGSSTRMGRDKADLRFDGETLLARTVRIVRSVVDSVIVVGPASRQEAIPGVPVIADAWPGTGPLGAVVTGLNSADAKAAFVSACDMPLLRAPAIQYLVSIASTSDVDAVIPFVNGRAQTLHAVYRISAKPHLRSCIGSATEKSMSLKDAIRYLTVTWVNEHDLRSVDPNLMSVRNVNTESDWFAFLGSQPDV